MMCLGAGMPSLASRSVWALVSSVRWRNVPAGPVKVPMWRRSRCRRMAGQVPQCGGLDDPDEQEGEPAQDDVGADALFQVVVDRVQVEYRFHVAPAAFDLQELLVAERDVLGGEFRVGGAQQVFPVEVLFGFDRGFVDAEQPAGVTRRNRFRPGMVEIFPRSSAR